VSQGLDPQISDLIEQTLPLVRHVMYQVTSHFPRHVDKEELVRAGVLGLVEAAHRFEPDKGVPFPPYAAQRIRGAIIDAVRKVDWAPRSLRRAGRNLEATADKLANDLHRSPTSVELSEAMGISIAALAELQHQLVQSVVLGLDMSVSDTYSDGDDDVHLEGTVPDEGVSAEEELCERETAAYLRDAVALLPDRHRVVIEGYFFESRTSADLAEELEITVSRVSQLRTEAFEILRHGLTAQYGDEVTADTVDETVSAKALRRRGAYAAAIATYSTWRSRLDGADGEAARRLQPAV
jgi:RNA polymerase sigma factor for flagellar operon FliA